MDIYAFLLYFCIGLAVSFGSAAPPTKGVPVPATKEVEPELACPADYTKQGGACIKTVNVDPTPKCPKGFELYGLGGPKKSHHSVHGESHGYRRSHGYRGYRNLVDSDKEKSEGLRSSNYRRSSYPRFDDSKKDSPSKDVVECVRIHTSPSIPYCPDGYELSKNERSCESSEALSPTLSCREDYELVGDQCVRSTVHEPGLECADTSFTMVGKRCARVVDTRPMEGCPEGFMMEGDKCVKVERMPPYDVCPEKSIPQGNRCIEPISVPGRPECPRGYDLRGDICMKREVFVPEKNCEGDAVKKGDECVVEKILDTGYKCDEGFDKDPSGFCVMKRNPVPFCPDGGTLNPITEKCEVQEAILPAVVCPRGWIPNDKDECEKFDEKPVEYNCPTGFKPDGDQCVQEKISSPYQKCPESFTLIEDICLRPSYQKKWQKCQDGFELRADRCSATEEIAPDFVCPTNYELKLNKCVAEHKINPEMSCPDDAKLRDGKCVTTTVKSPEQDCEKGYIYNPDTKECEDEEITPVDYTCPHGYTYNKTCVKTETMDPIPRCPDNYYYDGPTNNCVEVKRYVPVIPAPPVKLPVAAPVYNKAHYAPPPHSKNSFAPVSSPSKFGQTTTTYLDVPSYSSGKSSYSSSPSFSGPTYYGY